MMKHPRVMSAMKNAHHADHHLIDEQHVRAIIRSLPHSWEYMTQNMICNENLKTFEDISRHLEPEVEHQEAAMSL